MTTRQIQREDPLHSARHCLEDTPYRMIVFKALNHHKKPLYWVAGSDAPAAGAEKALKEAHRVHGGACFYCKKPVKHEELTIDHAEPAKLGGRDDLQNLLIACKPCNSLKDHKPIEAFHPEAGREWLSALLRQIQDRLNRLQDSSDSDITKSRSP
jgi:5-methylcytosine-specific restriction endonuclease McrA